jgi:hypothetical protein
MRKSAAVMMTVGALAFGAAACGPTVGGTNPPPDVATITAVDVPLNQVQPGKPFLFEADATDPGSNDYYVAFSTPDARTELSAEVCTGTRFDSPSPDTPWCEYDDNTTSRTTTTHTEGWFVWNGPVGATFAIQVCAGSFSNPVPDAARSCRTETFTAVAS